MSVAAPHLNIVMPLTLPGSVVRLEPIRREHAELFWEAARDALDDIFRWIPYPMKAPADFEGFVEKALDEQKRGDSIVFATVELSSGRVVGSTRFMNIDRANRRVEIGSTWIAPAWQRTAVNSEAKYLMLRQAFEQWGCIRVELKTDALNQKSRNAILRLGAKEEGHPAPAPDHMHRTRPRYSLFQHPRQRMARAEGKPGGKTRWELRTEN